MKLSDGKGGNQARSLLRCRRSAEKMVRGKVAGKKREEGFFRKGLRGTVPHRPPSQAWVRRCAARQGRRWRISRTRLASASLNPPQAALGSAPTADPHNPLMRPGGTPGTRWRAKSWQKPEDKRREKARPPNPTPTEGIGFWAAISAIGLWMDEKRLLALVFAWLVGP